MSWQPIATAPKDGTDIIIGFDAATVWVVHVAWWRSAEECAQQPDVFGPECVGWWSYVRGSVSQELLNDYQTPTHWMPLPPPPETTP